MSDDLLLPDRKYKPYGERLIEAANSAVTMPAGKVSKEMLTDIAQENVGLAFNKIVSTVQSSDDKLALQAAKEVIEIAHPKNADAMMGKVIAPVQINVTYVSPNKTEIDTITINTGDA